MFERACEILIPATEAAVRRGAAREAERALRGVLAHPRASRAPAEIHLQMAKALNAEGRFHDALNALATWEARSPSDEDSHGAIVIRAEAVHRGRLADDTTIVRLARRAREWSQRCGNQDDQLRTLQLEAEVAADAGDLDALAGCRREAIRTLETCSTAAAQAAAHLTIGFTHSMLGEPEEALAHHAQGVTLLQRLPLDAELRLALTGVGNAFWALGRLRDAIDAYEDAASLAERIGDTSAAAVCWSNLLVTALSSGDVGKAESFLAMAQATVSRSPSPRRASELNYNIAMYYILRHQFADALSAARAAREDADRAKSWRHMRDAEIALADIFIASEQPERAWECVDRARTLVQNREYLFPSAHYERLLRHHAFAKGGLGAYTARVAESKRYVSRMDLRDRLVLDVFDDWVHSQTEPKRAVTANSCERLVEQGYAGTARYLSVLGLV